MGGAVIADSRALEDRVVRHAIGCEVAIRGGQRGIENTVDGRAYFFRLGSTIIIGG